MADIDELFKFYRDECVPAYADLVGYLVDKPAQFLIEIENAFAHVAQYYNPEVDPKDKEKNISKAMDHLTRVTLDSYKLLWSTMDNSLTDVYGDDFKRAYCVNMAQTEFVSEYQNFKKLAQEAREIEIQNIGVQPLKALDAYKKVIQLGDDLIARIDRDKIDSSKKILRVISLKRSGVEIAISFFGGLLSGFVIIYWPQIILYIQTHIPTH
jgi:hypothetical protein